jgi:hypothetical protein
MSKRLRVSVLTSAVLAVYFVSTAFASLNLAYSNIFPSKSGETTSASFPTSNIADTVAISGYTTSSSSVWGIDTGTTEYKVYVPVYRSSTTVTIEYACEGANHAANTIEARDYEHVNGVSQTTWQLYRTNATTEEASTLIGTVRSADRPACTGNVTQSFVASGSPTSQIVGHGNYKVYIVKVWENVETGPDGAGKGFRIRAAATDAYVTPSELPLSNTRVLSKPAGDAYALLDGARTIVRDSYYDFTFGADCRIDNGERVFLKWYDVDYGLNQTGSISLRLYANGILVPLTAYNTSTGAALGPAKTVLSNYDLMGGSTASGAYGAASFIANRGVSYRIHWAGVEQDNALQFWLPFPEINTTTECPEPIASMSVNCSVANGWYAYVPNPADKSTVNVEFALSSSSSTAPTSGWGGKQTVVADDSSPDPPGYNFNNGFTVSVPSSYKSATLRTWARAYVVRPDGSYDWLSTGKTAGYCDSTNWDYNPRILSGSTPAGTIKPGDIITFIGDSINAGSGPGAVHTQEIRPSSNSGFVDRISLSSGGSWVGSSGKDARWSSVPAIAGGSSSSADRTATFRVRSDAVDGQQVCIETRVTPHAGQSQPTLTTTSSGWESDDRCYTVYNQYFEIDNLRISNIGAGGAVPGEEFLDVQFGADNAGSSATGSTASAFRIEYTPSMYLSTNPPSFTGSYATTIPAGQTRFTPDRDYTVPLGASLGEEYCVAVRVNYTEGYTDGAGLISWNNRDTSVISDIQETCVVILENPYLEVYGADVWAGAVFSPMADNPTACGALPASDKKIVSVRRDDRGSFTEFAAFATGSIINFGSAGMPGFVDLDDLTFGNIDTPPGNFSEEARCVPDYYSLLLDSDYTSTVGSFGSGRLVGVGDKTIYVLDGDVTIGGNITYANYNVLGPSQIPFFMLVTTGDINIESNVTELNGLYVSIGGTINTCSDVSGNLTASDCNSRLDINGAFIAGNVNFRRTHGGLLRGDPAEVFNFSPEMYLGAPSIVNQFIGDFEVDQFKDLPPVY